MPQPPHRQGNAHHYIFGYRKQMMPKRKYKLQNVLYVYKTEEIKTLPVQTCWQREKKQNRRYPHIPHSSELVARAKYYGKGENEENYF